MNQKEKEKLKKWFMDYSKIHKFDYDLFDLEAYTDSSLSLNEAQNEIMDKLEDFIYSDLNNVANLKSALKSQEKWVEMEDNKNVPKIVSENVQIKCIFNKPRIIGLIADANEGKSNLIYYCIEELRKIGKFNLYTYGLRSKIEKSQEIYSVGELEQIKNSIIIIDEMFSLFDLENRKVKAQIENTLRLIFHNNNVLLLCGLGDNFKKFISSKLDIMMFKKVNLDNLINGSAVKNTIMSYSGWERGSKILTLEKNETIIWNGQHFNKIEVPYLEKYDSKKQNIKIIG